MAGFVRSLAWDRLHGFAEPTRPGDIDLLFFDPTRPAEADRELEAELARRAPGYPWEVYNQAHLHAFNQDPPYVSTLDSFSRWAETVSTLGVRLDAAGDLEIAAPCGLDDLFDLVIRPNPHPAAHYDVFRRRLEEKRWRDTWPRARVVDPAQEGPP